MTVNALDPAIGIRDEQFRMHEFLDGQDDAVFDSETDSSASSPRFIQLHAESCTIIVAYPEFSTALFAYSTLKARY